MIFLSVNAQIIDSVHKEKRLLKPKLNWPAIQYSEKLKTRSFIIPSAMIIYGFGTLHDKHEESVNNEIKEELVTENPHRLIHADNYLQFAPAVSVYLLNAVGIKGKNNLRDRSMIFILSNVFVNGIVSPLKHITKELRPDSSAYTSFPSGHTAEAFANAEFLRQEYKEVNVWYGVAGYAMAVATGYLRLYNNKHWFGDVVAGAGIGIASTKLSYWLYPKLQRWLFKKTVPHTMLLPAYQNNNFALNIIHQF